MTEKENTSAESATIPPEINDIAERVANFNKDLKEALGKYELALTAEARIHDGKVLADPKVIDARVKTPVDAAK